MFILAIDMSTTVGSLALLNDDSIVTETVWDEDTSRNQRLFSVLPEMLKKAGIDPVAIDLFCIGLGPGAFSGLRISLSAIRGLALPDSKPIFGLSSAEAMAWQLIRLENKASVTVVGDARRSTLWLAEFKADGAVVTMTIPFTLVKWEELPGKLSTGTTVVSPDWGRIGEKLIASMPSGCELVRQRCTPTARSVALLALAKLRNGEKSLPLNPIYLHPPVFVAPRFAADESAGAPTP
jgi:tRNA threonylcarbamoyl adenosine modification protein YeaZ